MNYLGPISLILICVGIGYVIEPILITDKGSPEATSESETQVSEEGNEKELIKEAVTPPVQEETPNEPVAVDPAEEVAPVETEENIEAQDDPEEQVEEASEEVEEVIESPVETAESEPEPATTPEPVAVEAEPASIVDVMKASVKEEEVTEFKLADVISWKEGESFELEGESYAAGVVTFKSETILGVQENEAIALIKDGAVYKWLWEKTKLEMR